MRKVKTIAVVENRAISRLVEATLHEHGYRVSVMEVSEAAATLRAQESSISVLITNFPWLFLEFAPQMPLLYLSSSPSREMQAAFSACRVVSKPFNPEDLIRAIDELIKEGKPRTLQNEDLDGGNTALVQTALRVIEYYASYRSPAPEDLEALREAALESKSKLKGEALAFYMLSELIRQGKV